MTVTLRSRPLKNGSSSLYLDIYDKGVRHVESLELYLVPEIDGNAKAQNANAMAKALEIKAQRILGIKKEAEKAPQLSGAPNLLDWLRGRLTGLPRNRYYWDVSGVIRVMESYLAKIKRKRLRLDKVTKEFCKGFVDYMVREYPNHNFPNKKVPLAPGTCIHYRSAFSRALNDAVKAGLIQTNPMATLTYRIQARTKNIRCFLTMPEVQSLIALEDCNLHVRNAYLFSCFTGLRHCDLKALQWRDIIQTDNGKSIRITMQKTSREVIVPLCQQALSLIPKNAKPSARVLRVPSLNVCNKELRKMADALNIRKTVTFHTSRHTFATLLLSQGVDIAVVSKLLGHASVEITQVYAKVLDATKIDAVNLVNGHFGIE